MVLLMEEVVVFGTEARLEWHLLGAWVRRAVTTGCLACRANRLARERWLFLLRWRGFLVARIRLGGGPKQSPRFPLERIG